MGYLMIDHRGTMAPDGTKGRLQEFDTLACKHCQAVVAVLDKNHPNVRSYTPKFKCTRCNGPVCRACAALGVCNPIQARIEHAVKTGRWDEKYLFKQGSVPMN
jgi:hypothetical protein